MLHSPHECSLDFVSITSVGPCRIRVASNYKGIRLRGYAVTDQAATRNDGFLAIIPRTMFEESCECKALSGD